MTKARPIPESIDHRPGGLDKAQCANEGGMIFRVYYNGDPKLPLQWLHVDTKLSTCQEKK